MKTLNYSVKHYAYINQIPTNVLNFLQILSYTEEINSEELDFLLRFPIMSGVTSPVDFLTNQLWGGIKNLSQMDEFRYHN